MEMHGNKIRVTKQFSFEMAHALWNYDGACRHIHGHSYKLWVTVLGTPLSDPSDPKLGMVIDFGTLKKIVHEHIVKRFDHALVLSKNSMSHLKSLSEPLWGKVEQVDFQPTSENLIAFFVTILKEQLPDTVKLVHLKLQETETSFAEWHAADNES